MLVTDLPSMAAGMISSPEARVLKAVMVTASPLILYFKLGLRGTSSTVLVSATGSSGLVSATGSFFPPHPPRSRGSDVASRIKGKGFIEKGHNWTEQ